MAVRAAEIHAPKPALRLCGVNIAQAVITAKVVYPAGFGKATSDSIEHIERAYRPMIKRSLGVASSFPNDVFHAATEHDGLGVPRLLGGGTGIEGQVPGAVRRARGFTAKHDATVGPRCPQRHQRRRPNAPRR